MRPETRDQIIGTIAACLAMDVPQEVVEITLLIAGLGERDVIELMREPLALT